MSEAIGVVKRLMEEFSRLPGIGKKTAERLTYHLLRVENQEAQNLAKAIVELREKVRPCSKCYNLSEEDPCPICSNDKRDHSLICVVESPGDVAAIEKSGEYSGLYHVLGGVLSPLDGIVPDDLTVDHLKSRIDKLNIKEIIIATNPNTEGETTAHWLSEQITGMGVKVSRIALGLPMGSDLELADKVTLGKAISGRKLLMGQEQNPN